jgi:hypothetical protein
LIRSTTGLQGKGALRRRKHEASRYERPLWVKSRKPSVEFLLSAFDLPADIEQAFATDLRKALSRSRANHRFYMGPEMGPVPGRSPWGSPHPSTRQIRPKRWRIRCTVLQVTWCPRFASYSAASREEWSVEVLQGYRPRAVGCPAHSVGSMTLPAGLRL